MRNVVPAVMFAFAVFLFAPAAQAEIVVGGAVGQANVEYDLDFDGQDFTFDEGDTGWKIYGGFRFIKFFGVGASYIDFGVSEDTLKGVQPQTGPAVDVDLETDVKAWDLYAEGVLPLGSRFELFAKVGYVIWDAEIAAKNVTGVEDDDSGSDFAYGAGAAIKFAKLFAVRLEYQIFEIEETEKVDLASIGFDVRF